jgi:aspartyl-tRNA(Asn)/glutamyl-tRNA(Gln) amidotransferase subunit A
VKELMSSRLLHPAMRDLVNEALDVLQKLGASVDQVSIPLIEHASAVYVAISEPEAAARYRPYLVARGQEMDVLPRRRLIAASLIPAAVTCRALRVAERLRAQVDEALNRFDVLASATTPTAASSIPTAAMIRSKEEAWLTVAGGRSLFTNPFNVTGHPALSVPCGLTRENLPAGLQLIGRHYREEDVLRVAGTYQSATDWHQRRPPV